MRTTPYISTGNTSGYSARIVPATTIRPALHAARYVNSHNPKETIINSKGQLWGPFFFFETSCDHITTGQSEAKYNSPKETIINSEEQLWGPFLSFDSACDHMTSGQSEARDCVWQEVGAGGVIILLF